VKKETFGTIIGVLMDLNCITQPEARSILCDFLVMLVCFDDSVFYCFYLGVVFCGNVYK
jgi:hypothetical protein